MEKQMQNPSTSWATLQRDTEMRAVPSSSAVCRVLQQRPAGPSPPCAPAQGARGGAAEPGPAPPPRTAPHLRRHLGPPRPAPRPLLSASARFLCRERPAQPDTPPAARTPRLRLAPPPPRFGSKGRRSSTGTGPRASTQQPLYLGVLPARALFLFWCKAKGSSCKPGLVPS